MKKYVLFFTIASLISLGLPACTSKNVDSDEAAEDVTGDLVDSEDGEASEESGSEDDFAEEDSEEGEEGEESAEASNEEEEGDELEEGEEVAEEDGTEEEGAEELADVDELPADAEQPEGEAPQELATNEEPPPPPAEEPASEMPMSDDETQGLADVPAPRPIIPLKKMLAAPYNKNGINVNALYVARPGDTFSSVSSKIYGQDKVDELKTINSHLAHRDLKVGDKVYYNSPQRPADTSQMLTYYEDAGLPPEVYVSQGGDNIRVVSKNLLGDDNSWKEIWSTNPEVESKDILSEGTRLRYWPASASAPALASTPAPPAGDEVAMNTPPPAEEAAPMPEAPPEDMAAAPPPPTEEPPPPPAAAVVDTPPPPPPPTDLPPPPVAAPPMLDDGTGGMMAGFDQDQMMALGAGVILLLAAVALIIIIRKKKRASRDIDFHTATHTQIE